MSQHESLSSVPNKPASHSSLPSTLRLPQNDSSGSEKQRADLACKTLRIDRKLQGENLCKKETTVTRYELFYCTICLVFTVFVLERNGTLSITNYVNIGKNKKMVLLLLMVIT